MSDGVIITVEIVIKPELAEQVVASIPAMFDDTVTFPGFRSIRVVRHKEEPNRLLIMEHWDEEADYHAYQAFRRERGDTEANQGNLLSMSYSVWPALVGYAEA
jgi:quinol monooxygenase YgiN